MDDENGETKACPVCGEEIKAVAIKCRFCNEDLAAFEARREAEVEKDYFVGHPAVIYTFGQWFWVILTVGLAYIYFWYKSRALTYEITSQRIKIHHGFLSKTRTLVELYRVDDFDLAHPFGMRVLGYGKLHLKSSDRNTEDILLYGIKEIDTLYEKLRAASLFERERRGIKVWANA